MRAFVGLAMVTLLAGACSDGAGTTSAGSSTTEADVTGEASEPLAPPTSRAGETTTTTRPDLPCRDVVEGEGSAAEIAAVDFRFEPDCLELTADQGINVTNEGTVVHNVTLEIVSEPDTEFLGADLQPGENTATEAFGNQGPGADVYRLFCKYHEARGMEAFLRVS